MWAKLTDLVKRKPAAAANSGGSSAAQKAASSSSAAAPAAVAAIRAGAPGVVLPQSTRPLVSYMGSPYGVAPDFITQYPANIGTPIEINELVAHIERLSQPVGEPYGIVQFDGFDVEFKHLEHLESLRAPDAADYSAANTDANVLKNRYGNILPPEHTRVRLALRDGVPFSDYINANFVDGLCSPKRYIATQGPLPTTFDDFWRLVWEQEIAVILMLTREIESGIIKCARYWPEPDDDDDDDSSSNSSANKLNNNNNSNNASNGVSKMDADNRDDDDDSDGGDEGSNDGKAKASSSAKAPVVSTTAASTLESDLALVTFDGLPDVEPAAEGEEDARQANYGDVRVLFRGKRPGDEFVVRQFDLRRGGVVRHLTILQYTGWPDHGVPASPQGFVTLSRLADLANKLNARANAKLARKREVKKPLAPLLTHCSAGVGRTGTFITIHSLLERVKAAPRDPVSVHQTLYNIRTARPNSVQTKDQYRFCYVSLAEQIRHLLAEIAANQEAKRAYRAKKKARLEGSRDNERGHGGAPRSRTRSHNSSRTTSPRHRASNGSGGGSRSRHRRRSAGRRSSHD